MISLGLLEVFSTLCGFAQSIPRDHLCCVVPDHIIFFKYMEPSGTDVKVWRTAVVSVSVVPLGPMGCGRGIISEYGKINAWIFIKFLCCGLTLFP